MAHSNHHHFHPQDDLQPRAQRRRKRKSSDRGLPSDADLRLLATAYLEVQHQLWPELAKSGILPPLNDTVLGQMVQDYKAIHQSRQFDTKAIHAQHQESAKALAAIYARYSCDNSSPTSIVDQVVNALHKAKEEIRFVPWAFVFADYSVSGLDSARRGYLNCKSLVDHADRVIDTIYIDDFTRASRDSLEWWKLGWLCKRASVRMIGASDGFDLSSPNWDIQITIYGLLSRLFIRGLREKVARGMRGAARRQTCLGKPPMGFTRKLKRDEHGHPIVRPHGKPLFEWAVDPVSKDWVVLLFDLFIDQKMSPDKIAKHFNQREIERTDTWTGSSIKNMLKNPAYVGIFIWNRTRREFDYDTEKWTIKTNPITEWVVSLEPEKGVIPVERWRQARRLLKARKRSRNDKNRKSRNQICASTLFSGTLFCGYCGRELLLTRSTGKYRNLFCTNGPAGIHGCKLCTSKSTRIIENCLLGYLKEYVLTEAEIIDLIERANGHLTALASKPSVDVAPLRSEIAKLQKKIDQLVRYVEDLDEAKQDLREGYERRIVQLQKEVKGLREELQISEKANTPVPDRLTKKRVETYVADLRDILNQEIPMAAEALRQLTGPISIRQEPIPGKKHGARWIATFSPNLLALLRQIAKDKDYPDSLTLEFLSHGIWTMPMEVSISIEETPKYEDLAPKFKEMHESGISVHEIASRHKLSWQVALEIINFAETGERPVWHLVADPERYAGWEHFQKLSTVVAQLRDQQQLNWNEIAAEVQKQTGTAISVITVLRSYEWAHRRIHRQSAGVIKKEVRLGEEKFILFKELLQQGITSGGELARRLGISRSTTNRWKKRLNARE